MGQAWQVSCGEAVGTQFQYKPAGNVYQSKPLWQPSTAKTK